MIWLKGIAIAAGLLALLFALLSLVPLVCFYPPHNTAIAEARCKEYSDCALFWHQLRESWPSNLREMEQRLLPDDELIFVRIDHDPWGGDYRLTIVDETPVVASPGPDGVWETEDDVVYVPLSDD